MIERHEVGSPMSQATGGLLYLADHVADTREAGIEDQARDVLHEIDALLAAADPTCGWL